MTISFRTKLADSSTLDAWSKCTIKSFDTDCVLITTIVFRKYNDAKKKGDSQKIQRRFNLQYGMLKYLRHALLKLLLYLVLRKFIYVFECTSVKSSLSHLHNKHRQPNTIASIAGKSQSEKIRCRKLCGQLYYWILDY